MKRNQHVFREEDGVTLKFPEYMDVMRDPRQCQRMDVSIILPLGASDSFKSVSIRCQPEDTVGDLVANTFKKFKIREGRALAENTDRYIFKVVGYLDYLLHHEFLLCFYDHLVWATRKYKKLELELLKLSDADMMDLGEVLSWSVDDVREMERNKMNPDGDEWTEDCHALLPIDHFTNESKAMANEFMNMESIPITEIKWPFRAMVRGVEDCPDELGVESLFVEMKLYSCGQELDTSKSGGGNAMMMAMMASQGGGGELSSNGPQSTTSVSFSKEARFPSTWIGSPHDVSNLMPSTRIGFMLRGYTAQGELVDLAGVTTTLVDSKGRLLDGKRTFNLWPSEILQYARDPKLGKEHMPRVLNLGNQIVGENEDGNAGTLHVVFDSYPLPILAPFVTLNDVINETPMAAIQPKVRETQSGAVLTVPEPPSDAENRRLEEIRKNDCLYELTPQDKHLLWKTRHYCVMEAELLPKLLLSVNWTSPLAVMEARRLLVQWREFDRKCEALELLDIRYSDPVVREYAVRQADMMDDTTLVEFLLQLVQALKYEPYHDSPLARMLLRRAIKSPYRIGHPLFWALRSEMHLIDVATRFGPVLFSYLRYCGPHRVHLRRQVTVNDKIWTIAENVKNVSKDKRNSYSQTELGNLNPHLPAKFQLCLTPRIECKGIIGEECKVMESKKKPLWLCFENVDSLSPPFLAIFKAGDDLRQDQLTLQLLRIMDSIWCGEDLDLRMSPYLCCSTGDELGMLEVVKSSDTTAHIQMDYGGKVMGAFKDTPLDNWLRTHNKDSSYSIAVDNFVHSCAGYCVATYVLGLLILDFDIYLAHLKKNRNWRSTC